MLIETVRDPSDSALVTEDTVVGDVQETSLDTEEIAPVETYVYFGIDGEPEYHAYGDGVENGSNSYYRDFSSFKPQVDKKDMNDYKDDPYPGRLAKMLDTGYFNTPVDEMYYIDLYLFNGFAYNNRMLTQKIFDNSAATFAVSIYEWDFRFPVQKIIKYSDDLINVVYKLKSQDLICYAYVMFEKTLLNWTPEHHEFWKFKGEVYFVPEKTVTSSDLADWVPGYKLTDEDHRKVSLDTASNKSAKYHDIFLEYVLCSDGLVVLKMHSDLENIKSFYELRRNLEIIGVDFYKYDKNETIEIGYSSFVEFGITPIFLN